MSYADKRDHEKAFDSDEAGTKWSPNSHVYQLVSPSSALKECQVGVAWAIDGDTSWNETEHVYKTTTNS